MHKAAVQSSPIKSSWKPLMLLTPPPDRSLSPTCPVASHFVWEESRSAFSSFELSSFFSGAAAAATWQYKWLSMCRQLIGGDSLFVEPLARLIPNDTGPRLCFPTSFQHLPISFIAVVIIAALNSQFEQNEKFRWKCQIVWLLFSWMLHAAF